MRAIVLSDVHLRDAHSVKSHLVIRFLQEVASRFDSVYILGDLFDIWPTTSRFLIRTFEPVIRTLEGLVKEGHAVHYLEGNHDFHLGEYFTRHLGIRVYRDRIEEVWGNKRVYMCHGDLGNPREKGYRILRYILRHQAFHEAIRRVPSAWVYRLGLKSAELSRKFQATRPRSADWESRVREIYRQAAREIFHRGYDVVLMGHTHLPDDFSEMIDGRQCRYFNTGDWIRHFTYLEFDGEEFYTRCHPVASSLEPSAIG